MEESILLFTYGTLRDIERFQRWGFNVGTEVKHLGSTVLEGYKMYGLCSHYGLYNHSGLRYPFIVEDNSNESKIVGELYAVTSEILKETDRYEGVGAGLYKRVQLKLKPSGFFVSKDGTEVCVEVYVAGRLLEDKLREPRKNRGYGYRDAIIPIPSGDWYHAVQVANVIDEYLSEIYRQTPKSQKFVLVTLMEKRNLMAELLQITLQKGLKGDDKDRQEVFHLTKNFLTSALQQLQQSQHSYRRRR